MMKHIPVILCTALCSILCLQGCGDFSCGDILKPRFANMGKGADIRALKEKINTYETGVKSGSVSPRKLAIAYQQLGERYIAKKMWDPAIDAMKKAIGLGRTNVIVHHALGTAYAYKARETENADFGNLAEHHYKKALEVSPAFVDAAYGLALLQFYVQDKKEEGIRTLEELSAQRPSFYRGRFALGRFYYETGDTRKSLSVYETLYSNLEEAHSSPDVREYRRLCKENIDRLMQEMSAPGPRR
ncbi:MAG TPA: hypothetical protein PLT75_05850 [Spirochaetota bacterium]|nr:hypothetical protein [Spirochaetota bacterium]